MKLIFENWRKRVTEAEYEPGRAVADIEKSFDTLIVILCVEALVTFSLLNLSQWFILPYPINYSADKLFMPSINKWSTIRNILYNLLNG